MKLRENADQPPFDPSPLGRQTLVSSVILTDGWRSQPLLLPQLGLVYISFAQPPGPDFSSRTQENELRVMRYIFQYPKTTSWVLQPSSLTSSYTFFPPMSAPSLPSSSSSSTGRRSPSLHSLLRLFTPLCCHFLIRLCGGCYTWRKHVCAEARFMLMWTPRTPYGHRQQQTHPNVGDFLVAVFIFPS